MSDERATGFAVEMRTDGRPQILFTGDPVEFETGGERVDVHALAMIFASVNYARTLRDALSAFIAFHDRVEAKR